ncbi:sulfurtransferase TusB [Methylococcaceae bacterium WWC4]|nr:sulfurtransferase TusB [Methylococcaceae bacterium WWC4]
MLHIVASSPVRPEWLERIGSGDDVVLLDAAALSARAGHRDNPLLQSVLDRECGVFVLREYAEACGLAPDAAMAGVAWTDYAGLVDLTVKNPVAHTWR